MENGILLVVLVVYGKIIKMIFVLDNAVADEVIILTVYLKFLRILLFKFFCPVVHLAFKYGAVFCFIDSVTVVDSTFSSILFGNRSGCRQVICDGRKSTQIQWFFLNEKENIFCRDRYFGIRVVVFHFL